MACPHFRAENEDIRSELQFLAILEPRTSECKAESIAALASVLGLRNVF
jgi:hypothetical protein